MKKVIVIGIVVLLIVVNIPNALSRQQSLINTNIVEEDDYEGFPLVKKVDNYANASDNIKVHSGKTDSFLKYAEGAADWLINESIVVGDGFKWPDSVGSSNYYTDLYYGSSGIVTLFSDLYEKTTDDIYYEYAVGGANWLIDRAIPEAGGYKWPSDEESSLYYTGLYVGSAGTGDAFLNLYETLLDTIYLEYAEGAANWLMSVAIFEGQDECKWPSSQYASDYCTDIVYGASGIGLYFLRMYNLTNNQEYLDYACYAGNWLVNQATPAGSGYKWEFSNYVPYIYTGFSHGTAGIGYFLAELYEHTNESLFLDYSEGAGQWLIDIAVPENGGCKWWSKEGDTPNYSTGWCHGPAGTCLLFTKLYQITSENIYLTYAEMGGNWLIDLAVPSGDGYKWPHTQGYSTYDTTICHGAAGIGDFFLNMYDLTNDENYFNYAEGAGEWLKSVADSSASGYRWATFGSYYTGFSTGTSGVGLFFLDVYGKQNEPDLVCLGNLNWVDVKPGETVTGNFKVENVGEPGSELSWEIESYPTWGTWTFTPSYGTGLTPEMGSITVEVKVDAPDEGNKEFTGEVKVINSENNEDYEIIPVMLKTPRNKALNKPMINFLKSHPILFPILQQLLHHLGFDL
jgi:rhamnogalacturonyl hydrolase YesR